MQTSMEMSCKFPYGTVTCPIELNFKLAPGREPESPGLGGFPVWLGI